MRRFAGSCRFVYNKALALQKERHEQGQKKLGYAGLCQLLTAWRYSQTQAWFECVACGYENNADRGSGPEAFRGSGPEAFRGSGPEAFLVGAINILARGIQLLRDEGQDTADAAVGMRVGEPPVSARMACGSNCTGGRKQEPAETTAQGAIHAQRGRNLQPSGRGGCQRLPHTRISAGNSGAINRVD